MESHCLQGRESEGGVLIIFVTNLVEKFDSIKYLIKIQIKNDDIV